MTLLNLQTTAGPRLGVKRPTGVLDVAAAAAMYKLPAPVDIDDLLQNGKGGMLATLVAAAADGPSRLYLQDGAVQHAPLVTRPEKIIMMGFNYRRHAAETNTPIPANPVLFNKFNNALNHHGGTVALPMATARHFDHEVELVMVFGRECRNVSEADALDYVGGYCTGNDFSARDMQDLTSQFMIGKTFDGFAPLGPHLVTSDLRAREKNVARLDGHHSRREADHLPAVEDHVARGPVLPLLAVDPAFEPQLVRIAHPPRPSTSWLRPGELPTTTFASPIRPIRSAHAARRGPGGRRPRVPSGLPAPRALCGSTSRPASVRETPMWQHPVMFGDVERDQRRARRSERVTPRTRAC